MFTDPQYKVSLRTGPGIWTPPPRVTDHQGDKLDPESDFFVVPPDQIGAVKSAGTSLKIGVAGTPARARVRASAIWFVTGYILAWYLDPFMILTKTAEATHIAGPVWYALIGSIAAFIAMHQIRPRGLCTFVGERGCAQFVCRGEPGNITEKSIFLFKDAWALSTWRGRRIRNSRYSYTPFYFDWYAYPPDKEKLVYSLVGERASVSPAGNSHKFARAVENAWYDYLMPKVDHEIAQKGCIDFYEGGGLVKSWVRIGRGFVEIVYKDDDDTQVKERLEACRFRSVSASRENLTIVYESENEIARELGEATQTRNFYYDHIYNGCLFLYAFERVLGIEVASRHGRAPVDQGQA